MATEINSTDAELAKCVNQVQLNNCKNVETETITENGTNDTKVECDSVRNEWGFDLPVLYKLVVKFYKDQSGKAVQLTYSERCHLVALSQQVAHGPYDDSSPAAAQTLGIMDVVGRDRRVAWQSLGNMSAATAKMAFVHELHRLAPTLKPYIEACWADHLHQLDLEREKREEQERLQNEEREKEDERRREEDERRLQEQTKREIQNALNQQTYSQFRSYAEHQFPGNPEQQGVLIRQLQDQHYQQYMQQVYQQQLQKQQQAYQEQQQQQHEVLADAGAVTEGTAAVEGGADCLKVGDGHDSDQQEEKENGGEEGEEDSGNIAAAAMWTRRDVQDFKSAVQQEGPNTVLRVGHGETVTVRVPTHQDGSCLFWEFATDAYDIGFGLYFEWTTNADTAVTVHVTESDEEDEDEDDDEEDEDEDDDYDGTPSDLERGSGRRRRRGDGGEEGRRSKTPSPPQTVIIPVYRRDCHQEVYAGSHTYPGTGVYLLKFDNSYSVWRSKTLYYRVYYTQ